MKGEAGPDVAPLEATKELKAHPAYGALLLSLEQTAEASTPSFFRGKCLEKGSRELDFGRETH